MGKGEPIRPSWAMSVGEMLRVGASCRAMCTACDGWRDVDLQALLDAIGPDACLWGKRVNCRLLPGCTGANRFFYLQGGSVRGHVVDLTGHNRLGIAGLGGKWLRPQCHLVSKSDIWYPS